MVYTDLSVLRNLVLKDLIGYEGLYNTVIKFG
jgi:hypothetical protein